MITITRYGNTAENNSWVYGPGIVTQDTEAGALRVHDGVTPGGWVVEGTDAGLELGPGSQDIVAGDGTAGFMGEITATEFTSTDALSDQLGITHGVVLNGSPRWLKFYYQGKVLFYPKKPLRGGFTWEHINSNGLVDQGTIVDIDGYSYIVRLIRGSEFNPTDGDLGNGGEWNALIYPVHVDDPNAQGWGVNYTNEDLQIDNRFWCYERGTPSTEITSTSTALQRGGNEDVTHQLFASIDWDQESRVWSPILELVGPTEVT